MVVFVSCFPYSLYMNSNDLRILGQVSAGWHGKCQGYIIVVKEELGLVSKGKATMSRHLQHLKIAVGVFSLALLLVTMPALGQHGGGHGGGGGYGGSGGHSSGFGASGGSHSSGFAASGGSHAIGGSHAGVGIHGGVQIGGGHLNAHSPAFGHGSPGFGYGLHGGGHIGAGPSHGLAEPFHSGHDFDPLHAPDFFHPSHHIVGSGFFPSYYYGPSYGSYGYAPPPAASGLTLLAFLDYSIVAVTDYWTANGELHYITADGAQYTVPLDQINLDMTVQLNRERGVEFILR